ncbi:MAG TPA: hypothetical protein VGW78_04355 [Candidatus Babeliales bacterium]|jgi:small neutral amino acid transporter SnatA (MarC family)|nr:hypothetical protein [Candidatus Babeliales bacterium]
MAFSFKHIICTTILAGSIAQSTHGSSLLPLVGTMAGNILTVIGSLALCTEGHKTTISKAGPPSMQNIFNFPCNTPLLLVPGIVLSLASQLHMHKKVEGFGNKLRATIASLGIAASVSMATIGFLLLQVHASQNDQNFIMQAADAVWYQTHQQNNPFTPDFLDKIKLISHSCVIVSSLLASLALIVAP